MKKTSLALFLICTLLVLSLTACAGSETTPPNGSQSSATESQGAKGEKGEDGLTPYIGTNGNWWIGNRDTGVNASGIKGDQGENGIQGVPGDPGKTAEFREKDGWIQWKYSDEDDLAWKNLYEYGPTVNHVYIPVPNGVSSAQISTYSSTNNYGLAGVYSVIDNKEYAEGATIKLTATVNKGYSFEGWYINDECISSELECEYTVSSRSVDIEARYSFYALSVTSWTDNNGAAGKYTSLSNQKIVPGEKIELTATVNPGYTFDGWFINDRLVSNSLLYVYEMTDSDQTIEARYSSYTVSTSSVNNVANVAGTYTNLYNKKVSVGDTVELVATVNSGYNFEGWYVDEVLVSKELNYSYVMERSDVEITAVFSAYTVNTFGGSYNASWEKDGTFVAGTYTSMSNKNVSAGESVTLKATVNPGYCFVGWYINDVCVETAPEYQFIMEKADIEIEARYVYYRLTVTGKRYRYPSNYPLETPELYISPVQQDAKTLPGTTVTLTAIEMEGYVFCGWRTNDSTLSHDMTYSFTMPANDVYIFAYYEAE